jgi:hypothetical protein
LGVKLVSQLEVIWSFGALAALQLGLMAFKRLRRRTSDFHQSAKFKEQLPGWVRQFEFLTMSASLCASLLAVSWLFIHFVEPSHGRSPTGAAAVFLALGIGLISMPSALLSSNLVSWLIPPVRAANERAMEGLQVSFWSMNRGLLQFAAVSVPLGIGLLALEVVAPWRQG